MARDLDQLVLTLSADIRRLEKNLDKAQGKLDSTGRAMAKRQREIEREFEKLGASIGDGIKRGSQVAQIALAGIVGYSIKAAASATELRDAFKIAFGEGAAGAEAYAKALSDKAGRSQLEIMESMTKFRLLLKGQAPEVADSLTRALQERAIDVGSLFNLKDADVITKFFSGLSGETEPLKALGVALNEAAMKAEFLKLGYSGVVAQAPEAVKQIARANIILRETEIAAGNAANTIDSTANRFKTLQGETRDAAAAFGEQFLPIANAVLEWATNALTSFDELPVGIQRTGLAMLALIAAGGPIAGLIANFAKLITLARTARAAMLGVGLASAGAGVAGAAGAGAAAVGIGATAAVAGVLTQSGSTRQADRVSRERELANWLRVQVQESAKLEAAMARGDVRAAERARTSAANAEAKARGIRLAIALEKEEQRVGAVDGAPVGGFGLGDLPRTGAGGAGASGRAAAAAAKREAERRAKERQEWFDKNLRAALEVVMGRNMPLDMMEDSPRSDIQSLISDASGISPQDDIIKAAIEGSAAIRTAMRDSVRDGVLGGLYAAANGEGVDYLAAILKQKAFEALATSITNSLMGASQGGGIIGSLAKAAISIFSPGPGRASGGPVRGGRAYTVGEHGPEMFVPGASGSILPNSALLHARDLGGRSAAPMIVTQTLNFDIAGAVMTTDILRQMNVMTQRSKADAINIINRAAPGRMRAHEMLAG